MSMVDSEALPPEPPPLADPGGVPVGTKPPPSLPVPPSSGVTPMGASGVNPVTGVDLTSLAREAGQLLREKTAATSRINQQTEAALVRDRARLQQQYEATGIGPDELKPWDADAAREKYRHDPIEAFGSIGSVFAMIASAFTNRPMENAMMGAAAAINAVKEGKAADHDRAYKAWEDNTKLAINRQKIQNQQFSNAVTLMNTDMALGQQRAKMLADQYGDKQTALLLDNGLYKEAIDLNQQRQRMTLDLEKVLPDLALENYKVQDLMRRTEGMARGSMEWQREVSAWTKDWKGTTDEDDVFTRKFFAENPNATAEQFSIALGEHRRRTTKLGSAGGSIRQPKPQEEAVRDIARTLKAEADAKGTPMSEGEALMLAERQYRMTTATPSGNRLDDIAGDIDQIDNAMTAANENLDFLENYTGGAGAAGMATRLAERVGNIFGSDETARVSFQKRIAYMKMIAPRILTMSRGRPLAAEASNVNAVIAGLGFGDTTANTIKAMKDFNVLMKKMQVDFEKRRAVNPGKPNTPASSDAPAAAKKEPWFTDPAPRR